MKTNYCHGGNSRWIYDENILPCKKCGNRGMHYYNLNKNGVQNYYEGITCLICNQFVCNELNSKSKTIKKWNEKNNSK